MDRRLPELAGRQVLRRLDGPRDDTVPANRPRTARDRRTCRLGFGLIWGPPRLGSGVAMVIKRDAVAAVPGRCGWDGGDGTSWASDPGDVDLAEEALHDAFGAD